MQNSLGIKLGIKKRAAENRTGNFKLITSEPPNFREEKRFANKLANHLLNSFSLQDSAYFLSFAKNINFSAGESVYRHGDNIGFIYFPVTAVFSQFQVLEDGRTCEIAMIGSEGCVGMSGIMAAGVSNCWTEVSVAGRALKISAEILQREFKNNSLMRTKIIDYLNFYSEQLSQKIICNYFHQVKERFCSLLLMLQDRRGENSFSFTQEEIARRLGVHRPSLSCAAKELQQEKLISYSRGRIEILDRQKLENSACICGLNFRNHVSEID